MARAYLRLRFNLRIEGLSHLPDAGCVIGANHASVYDPILLSALLPRLPRHLAADELLGRGSRWSVPRAARPVVRWALGGSRAIPVARFGRDVAAIREAMRGLRAGDHLVVYMQGGIGGEAIDPGAAWLATHAGVPLVPVRIAGLPARGWRPRVTVSIRPSVRAAVDGESTSDLARRAWQAIAADGPSDA